jgi:hypothetical protein
MSAVIHAINHGPGVISSLLALGSFDGKNSSNTTTTVASSGGKVRPQRTRERKLSISGKEESTVQSRPLTLVELRELEEWFAISFFFVCVYTFL